jgi:general stress protein YciG
MSTNKNRNRENIYPRTPDEAREIGRKGGIASGAARREKKLLSAEYARMLASENGIAGNGLTLEQVIGAILARCDSASVSMLKEIREATEGSRLAMENTTSTPVPFVFVDPPKRQPV